MGHEYSVELDPHIFRNENNGGGKGCANDLKIVVGGNMHESNQAEIFMHEIIEQVCYRLQLKIDHDDLSALSEGLFQVIRDNKLRFDE